jgi:hypothetical protein
MLRSVASSCLRSWLVSSLRERSVNLNILSSLGKQIFPSDNVGNLYLFAVSESCDSGYFAFNSRTKC